MVPRILIIAVVLLAGAGGCAFSASEWIEELSAEDADDRFDAAVALGEDGVQKAVGPLDRALAHDESARVRAACARALARLGGDTAAAALLRALDDKDARVRTEAMLGIAALRIPAGAEKAAKHLAEDASPGVRGAGARCLGALGAADRVEALIQALSDPDDTVRLQAQTSLRRITRRDFGPYPEDWARWAEAFGRRMKPPSETE